jgi:mono/diheme cytochrome c family protein
MEGRFPPLAGSEWVSHKDARIPVRIVLNGLIGPIEVKGNLYRREMPPLGGELDDAEVAAVLSYVRTNWGNMAGAVDPQLVSKVRAESAGQGQWTAERLEGGK